MISHCGGCKRPVSEVGMLKNMSSGTGQCRKMRCKECRWEERKRLRLGAGA